MGVSSLAGTRVKRRFLLGAAAGALALFGGRAEAQRTHVLIVTGLSGDPAFKQSFRQVATTVRDVARTKWGVSDSSLIVLTEDSLPGPLSRGRSTRDAVANAFMSLSQRVQPGDVFLVLLVGHGSGEGPQSKVNLPGVDATAADYATWVSGFSKQTVVFVNTATGSGDFVPVLKGTGRVVVTATRSAVEKNESIFAGVFAQAVSGDAADADKDGRISVLEAFRFTTREVAKVYETSGRLQTEHAQISDSVRATTVSFGKSVTSNDPRVVALVAERQALESQVADLRGKKASMDSTAYERELERLLIAIAEKSAAIRAAGGKP